MKRVLRRIIKVAMLVIVGYFVFQIYRAIYPADDFFAREFSENTLIPFPESASVINKTATFPDIHGTYTACAVIRVSAADYKIIENELELRKRFPALEKNFFFLGDSKDFFEGKGISMHSIRRTFTVIEKHQIKVALLKDGKSLIFERHSS